MKKFLVFFLIIWFGFSQKILPAVAVDAAPFTPTPTVEYVLPYPGLLPNHPLYQLKTLRDKILLFFTREPNKKAQINLLIADKHLVMGQLLWEQNDQNLSVKTLDTGEKYLLTAALQLTKLKNNNALPPGFSDKLELAAKKHEEVINKLASPGNNKEELTKIIQVTHQARQQAASVK